MPKDMTKKHAVPLGDLACAPGGSQLWGDKKSSYSDFILEMHCNKRQSECTIGQGCIPKSKHQDAWFVSTRFCIFSHGTLPYSKLQAW